MQGGAVAACPRSYASPYLDQSFFQCSRDLAMPFRASAFTRIKSRNRRPFFRVYQCEARPVAIRLRRGVAGHGFDEAANNTWVARWEGERELPVPRTRNDILTSAHQGRSSAGNRPAQHGRRRVERSQELYQRRVERGTAQRTKAAAI